MMRQISIADAIGKRLTGFETWLRELAVLTFDDGTFAVLEAHQEYESAEISAVVPDRNALDVRRVCTHLRGRE